jgi:hypothetical protein
VRTWFEIEETDVCVTARQTLLRRYGAWATARGLVMVPSLAEALVDSRYFSSDGRLGYWIPAQVERALLDWIPGRPRPHRRTCRAQQGGHPVPRAG